MRAIKFLRLLIRLYKAYVEDDIPASGAGLAFYLMLSFFPFIIFIMTIISFGNVSMKEIMEALFKLLPHYAYQFIYESIYHIAEQKQEGFLFFSIITTLWAASRGMSALSKGLNKAYSVIERRPFWQVKAIAIIFTLGLGITIIFSFLLLIFGNQFGIYLYVMLGLPLNFFAVWNIIRYSSMLLIMIFIFAALYRYMPCKDLKWKGVIPGAIFTTGGWIVISMSFGFYVDHVANYSRIYGSIGGMMVFMFWLFISSLIILTGGELNAILLDQKKVSD